MATWFKQKLLQKKCKDENIYNWLVDDGNLTKKLKKTNHKFSFRLLSQDLEKPYADEIAAFTSGNAEIALVRKVVHEAVGWTLLGQGPTYAQPDPYIYARVIVPEQSYLNYKNILDNLGNSPIGSTFLYRNPQIKRQPFEYKLITAKDEVFAEIKSLSKDDVDFYWGRRSFFNLPKGCLLISEFFLNFPC